MVSSVNYPEDEGNNIFQQTRRRFPEGLNLKWKGMEYALQHLYKVQATLRLPTFMATVLCKPETPLVVYTQTHKPTACRTFVRLVLFYDCVQEV